MKIRTLLFVAFASVVPLAAHAQTGLVYELGGNTLVATFDAGQARGVMWSSATTFYVTQAAAIQKYNVDATDPLNPVVSSAGSLAISAPPGGVPGNILIYGTGATRAFVPGIQGGGVGVYNLTGTQMTQMATIPVASGTTASATIYPGGNTALFPAGSNLVFTGGLASDMFAPTAYPFVAVDGTPLNGVAAYAYYADTAAVSLDSGGFQVINTASFPPSPRGPVTQPPGCNYSPSMTFMPFRFEPFPCVITLCSATRGGSELVAMTDVTDPTSTYYVALMPLLAACTGGLAMDLKQDDGFIFVAGNAGFCKLGFTMDGFSYPTLSAPIVVERQGVALSPDSRYMVIVGHN